jgi:protein gp37
VFDNAVPVEWRRNLFDLIELTPNLDWLLLTKRIGNVADMVREARTWDWLLGRPNVWLGATIVNQEEADRDIPKLLAVPARVRFLSMEPLLGPVNLSNFLWQEVGGRIVSQEGRNPRLHWVIVGGESGHGARPMQLQWVRSIVQQCRAAGVPVLVKQLGREVLDDGMSSPGEHWPITTVRGSVPRRHETDPAFVIRLHDRKGGDWSEWPEDLRVREFPHA